MQIGIIGLGKMGGNMSRRLLDGGHKVSVFDRSSDAIDQIVAVGGEASSSLEDLVEKLSPPRVLWMMIPAGKPVEETVKTLQALLAQGDILVDGGNSNYKETIARAALLKSSGIDFVDAGTSGGVWGLELGYCLMLGAEKSAFLTLEPALKTLAPENGYLHAGRPGAGHFVKMIHNGIEYGLMQAYAEGFDLLEHGQFELDLPAIANLWNQGSVIRSWLLELSEAMLKGDPGLDGVKGFVPDSGEGRWTVQESIDLSIPTPVITASLQARFRSRRENTFSDRFLAALRREFGGHAVKKS